MTNNAENYVVVDVDCGVDDAWSLLMLIRAEMEFKKFKILAITCVSGNTDVDNVARNTLRLLESLNRTDIPVYKGCSQSIIARVPKRVNYYYGKDGFGDISWEQKLSSAPQKDHAVNKMYNLVCEFPKKITFILLGPLTNFGICSTMYSDFNEKIKDIFVMGGNWRGRGNTTKTGEFNFYSDPESAKCLFENTKNLVTILPLETILEGELNLISMDWRIKELGVSNFPPVNILNKVEEACVFSRGSKNWIECDVILIASFLFPKKMIKKSTKYHVTVELHGWETRGQMILDHKRASEDNAIIIQDIDQDIYKKILLWTADLLPTSELLMEMDL